jgi:hypothetical protein
MSEKGAPSSPLLSSAGLSNESPKNMKRPLSGESTGRRIDNLLEDIERLRNEELPEHLQGFSDELDERFELQEAKLKRTLKKDVEKGVKPCKELTKKQEKMQKSIEAMQDLLNKTSK